MSKGLAKLMSYASVFMLGVYTCCALRYNDTPELYHWILTSMFGMFFYLLSLPEKDKI